MTSQDVLKWAYQTGYRVNDEGILIAPNGKIRQTRTRTNGYYDTNVRINGKLYHLSPHRLCAYQKYGDSLFGADCVRHLDGNPKNNKPSNIAIGSNHDNMLDIPPNVRRKSAITASRHIIVHDNEKVQEIREYYKAGHTYKDITEKFGITSKGTIWFILNKRLT